ncbi:Deoxyhypusine synthase, partial [Nibea albiflora]
AASSGASPSPSPEARGLLSLPWEMVTHIASHLPAHCVITVLPKVCHALGNVGKDNTAWQLRARRLIGSRAGFPVGPREDFDWPSACLEMEQLITCWTGQGHLMARRTQEDEEDRGHVRQQQGAGRDGEAAAEGQEDGGEDEIEGVGVVAQEVAYGVDEGMEVAMEGEDGELQPVIGGDQLARLREALEERLDDDAAALMEDADGEQGGALNPREALADPRNLGNGRPVEMEQHPPSRSPSPPPALECITLPSGHIAQVNSVLLVGGEGKVCATGSRDWNVKLWDLQGSSGGTLLHTLGGQGDFSTHRGWVWCLASQGPLLASGGFDSTVRLWDLQAGGAERGLIRPGAAVLCLSCQTDVLLAGTFDKRVSMYDTRGEGAMQMTWTLLSSYLLSMTYSGSEVWAGDNGGMLHSFSMQAGTIKPLSQFDVGHTALVTGIHRSPGSLYTCSSDRTVKMADQAPSVAMEAVLKPSCDLPEDMPKIRGYDFNQGVDLQAVLKSYLTTGFQASRLGLAIQEINQMIEKRLEPVEPDEGNECDKSGESKSGCTIFLGYTSNLISSGVRESIRYLAEHKMVDVIVTTAGGIEEDLIKCLAHTYLGDFSMPGKDLRQRGINRIGNLLVPNDNYCKFEDWLIPILDQMLLEQNTEGTRWTPSKMIHRLGKEINNTESVYYWAYKNNIPVFSPALTDGSLGDMIYFHSFKNPGLVLDIVEDIRKLNSQAVFAKRTGMIILGGGLVKHHIANANLMRNGADYAVFVNTGQEFDGSDSGARPDEAVSWGKIRTDAKPVIHCSVLCSQVYADASLVFPLIVAETFALHADKLTAGKKTD